MRTNWLRCACAAVLVIAGTALAQSPDITSFHGNGQLTWINSDTNLFYRIEWASSLTAPDTWQSNYFSLTDIRPSASIVTSSVPMFYRVCGSSNRLMYASPVPKTGQTTSYQTGDNGYYTNGVAWPNPRFTVQADTNCVLDNLTGLVWARNANLGGPMNWSAAITYCEGLTYGGTNDWRLSNWNELRSLIDAAKTNPALPIDHPFTGVQSLHYWSSTTSAGSTASAWIVTTDDGNVYRESKTLSHYVWPVRGGL